MKNIFLFYIGLFIILFFTALSFNYVEGDDASTIIYHVMGRDASIESPYAPYNSMLDAVLTLLPRDESVLRVFTISFSFLTGLIFLISLTKFVNYFVPESINNSYFYFLPFLIPEFLISSLTIDSTKIGMSFLVFSFIYLHKYLSNRKWILLIVSALLFGLGSSFRWNLIGGLAISIGVVISYYSKEIFTVKRLVKPFLQLILVSILFIFSFLFFLFISGYTLFNVLEIFLWGTNYMDSKSWSLARILPGISWLTPAFIIVLIVGLVKVIKTNNYKAVIFFLFSLLPFVVIGFSLNFKISLLLIPALILVSFYGYEILKKKKSIIMKLLIALCFFPWLMGIQFETKRAWGPRFEIKAPYEINESISIKESISFALFEAGTAFPMPEGPRPIYGYFGLLFGGEWKDFIINKNTERVELIKKAIVPGIIVTDSKNSTLELALIENGFRNYETRKRGVDYFYRDFYLNDTMSIKLLYPLTKNSTSNWLKEYMKKTKSEFVYFASDYTGIIKELDIKFERSNALGPLSIKVYNE